MKSINMDIKEETGFGNRVLLDKIDKLREVGLSEMIPLPQIVAAGEQSAGKSSLLESLTGISFPRSVSLCTRFATEIICRRENTTSIVVTIQPDPGSASAHAESARAFRQTVANFTGDEFASVFKQAAQTMGIKTESNDTSSAPTFTRDVLRIEKSGPNEDNLTIIDVPGIFENESPGITTKSDIAMVKDMVKSYIKDSRTIILAVVPCNTDIATQTIIRFASEVDPAGQRTLGVLTKPDLAVETATKNVVADLVRGQRRDLHLGYFVVRNRGADDQSATIDMVARDAEERAFFSTEPWSSLDRTRVGIRSLRSRLRELLADRTKSEFPNVRREVNSKLQEAKRQLKDLGAARAEPDEQRIYLGQIAGQFSKLVQYGLDAYYTADDSMFIKRKDLRLITQVRELNEAFAKTIFMNGHAIEFQKCSQGGVPENRVEGDDGHASDGSDTPSVESDSEGDAEEPAKCRGALYHEPISFEIPEDDEDLDGILVWPSRCTQPSKKPIIHQIEKMYKSYRGYELGTFGPDMVPTAFRVQAARWESAALAHVSNVILVVNHFIRSLIEEACSDPFVRAELWSFVLEGLTQRYSRAMEHARFLIQVELSGKAVTCIPMFDATVDKLNTERLAEQAEGLAFELPAGSKYRQGKYVHVDYVKQIRKESSGSRTVCEKIHDVMKSYYEVVRARFVDNICVQAVDHYLLSGESSPLRVFGSDCVLAMSPEQLESIASEDGATRSRRASLQREKDLLEKAVSILR